MIRVHEKYLSWEKAAPILLSILLYKQPLPSDVNINLSPEDIEKKKMDDRARKTSSWFGWWGKGNAEASIKGEAIKTEPQPDTSWANPKANWANLGANWDNPEASWANPRADSANPEAGWANPKAGWANPEGC